MKGFPYAKDQGEDPAEQFVTVLKKAMDEDGVSMTKLAQMTGLSKVYIGQVMKSKKISTASFFRCVKALNRELRMELVRKEKDAGQETN